MATSTRNSCFELLFPISIQVMCLSSMEKQCPMPLLDVHVIVSFLFIPSFHMHTPVYLPIWALEWNPTRILTMTASLHNFDPCWQANTCWTYSHILIFLLHDKSPFFFFILWLLSILMAPDCFTISSEIYKNEAKSVWTQPLATQYAKLNWPCQHQVWW